MIFFRVWDPYQVLIHYGFKNFRISSKKNLLTFDQSTIYPKIWHIGTLKPPF